MTVHSSPAKIWRESKKRYQHLGKIGRILSLTKIQTPVRGFERDLPYFVAFIQLESGEKVTGQLKVNPSSTESKRGRENEKFQPESAKGDRPLARAGSSQRLAGLWSAPLAEKIKNGNKVIGVLRRLKEPDEKGIIEYGVKWRVISSPPSS